MSAPTPTQSLSGGVGLALHAYSLLIMNGSVFGISGFLHRSLRGSTEACSAVLGLVVGGIIVGLADGEGPDAISVDPLRLIIAGALAGVGTKLGNGCTSGHMICGLSRFSTRSIIATATFFITGVIATYLFHADIDDISAVPWDWSVGDKGPLSIALQACFLGLSAVLPSPDPHSSQYFKSVARKLASFNSACGFALALRLSNLTSPHRVLRFLILPFHHGFDISLAFLAAGALPLSVILYHYFRGEEKPRLGGEWSIPKGGKSDLKLIVGSALFGIGWGIGGICPGPALVNLGRAIPYKTHTTEILIWLMSFIASSLIF